MLTFRAEGNPFVQYKPESWENLSPCPLLSKETYNAPQILVFGDVMTLARGSGSGDSDGCSSGHYDE